MLTPFVEIRFCLSLLRNITRVSTCPFWWIYRRDLFIQNCSPYKNQEDIVAQVHTHRSARVVVRAFPGGIIKNTWAGLITWQSLKAQRKTIDEKYSAAMGVMAFTDKAILTFNEPPIGWDSTRPVAVIVSPAQLEVSSELSRRMQRLGVLHTTWLEEDLWQAECWLAAAIRVKSRI
jgi:hypothetical protein